MSARNADIALNQYERDASLYERPKKHEQTCAGYGLLALCTSVLFLIFACALIGVEEQRREYNASLQTANCVVDNSSIHSTSLFVFVHYNVSSQYEVINSTLVKKFRSAEEAMVEFQHYLPNATFICFYEKNQVGKLVDEKNAEEVLIPSIVFFALFPVPFIVLALYYYLYWKKLIDAQKNAELQKAGNA